MQTSAVIQANRLVTFYGGTIHSLDTWDEDSTHTTKICRDRQTLYFDGSSCETYASYVNHSCDPNCQIVDYVFRETLLVGVVSTTTIYPEEYITVDYGQEYCIGAQCCCGKETCRDKSTWPQFVADTPCPIFTYSTSEARRIMGRK